jgi:hypothetical protein
MNVRGRYSIKVSKLNLTRFHQQDDQKIHKHNRVLFDNITAGETLYRRRAIYRGMSDGLCDIMMYVHWRVRRNIARMVIAGIAANI